MGDAPRDAAKCVSERLSRDLERAQRGKYLTHDEIATVQAAVDLTPAFKGERPVPCHRDYCPANWLVSRDGRWAGVFDLEFSGWDVRVADFTRDPDWAWIRRPDLLEAFFAGYGRPFSPKEKLQLLVGHTEYALGAIIWGRESRYFGFEREGHEALARLNRLLRSAR